MKNICKIKVHPLSYIVSLIFFFTGHIRDYIALMMIILIHELGHVLFALYFKWHIEKIIILPFGGLTKFQDHINQPINQELIIAIMGVVFQLFFCYHINSYYNIIIIIFNLLPIYPLDGAKILNLILNKINNFKTSYLVSLYISYIMLFIVTVIAVIHIDIMLLVSLMALFFQLNNEYKNRYNYINKFYLERYLYTFHFKRRMIIHNINRMKRDYQHLFYYSNNYLTEREFLKKWFDKSN